MKLISNKSIMLMLLLCFSSLALSEERIGNAVVQQIIFSNISYPERGTLSFRLNTPTATIDQSTCHYENIVTLMDDSKYREEIYSLLLSAKFNKSKLLFDVGVKSEGCPILNVTLQE